MKTILAGIIALLLTAPVAAQQSLKPETERLCREKTESLWPGVAYTAKTRDMTRASAETRIEIGNKNIICLAGLNLSGDLVILRFRVIEDLA